MIVNSTSRFMGHYQNYETVTLHVGTIKITADERR